MMRLAYQLLKTTCLLWLLAMGGQSFAVDTDNDGLSDDWELENGRDPLVADYMASVGVDLTNSPRTCVLDDAGVTCGEQNPIRKLQTPEFSNPKHLSIGFNAACVLGDTGLIC